MQTVGMVQVGGTTYRVERLSSRHYQVVRIVDDATVGTFFSFPRLQVVSTRIQLAAMHEIARAAVRQAKAS